MIVIAENLNTRNKTFMNAVKKKDKKALKELLKKLDNAGADIINLQCSLDGIDDENTLPWVTEVLCNSVKCGISLMGAYTIGFFLFWLLTASSCLLTCYFQRPCAFNARQGDQSP